MNNELRITTLKRLKLAFYSYIKILKFHFLIIIKAKPFKNKKMLKIISLFLLIVCLSES